MAIEKFRLSLSLPEVAYLIDTLGCDNREGTAKLNASLVSRLKLLQTKADLGITQPAFSSTEKLSIEDKLFSSPADRRSAAYSKWKINPAICTLEELRQVQMYRYENNLMTPEEESAYEES